MPAPLLAFFASRTRKLLNFPIDEKSLFSDLQKLVPRTSFSCINGWQATSEKLNFSEKLRMFSWSTFCPSRTLCVQVCGICFVRLLRAKVREKCFEEMFGDHEYARSSLPWFLSSFDWCRMFGFSIQTGCRFDLWPQLFQWESTWLARIPRKTCTGTQAHVHVCRHLRRLYDKNYGMWWHWALEANEVFPFVDTS